MEITEFTGHGRTLAVIFQCARCKTEAVLPLEDCLPTDYHFRNLSELKTPKEWRNGGVYHPTFCPECAEKYDKFMRGEN